MLLLLRRCLLLPVLLLALISAHALPQSQDSLLRVVQAGLPDTNQVIALLHYGAFFENTAPDTAAKYYEQSRVLARRLHYRYGEASYASYMLVLLNNTGRYEEGLRLCLDALHIYKTLGRELDVAIANNNVSNQYQYLGQYRLATSYGLTAIALAEKLGRQSMLRMYYNNLGAILIALQDYGKGLAYASRAYEIARKLEDTAGMASCLINMGVAENKQKHNPVARGYFNQVIALGGRLNDYTYVLDGQVNLITIDIEEKNFRNAMLRANYVLVEARKNENPTYELSARRNMAEIAVAGNDWATADREADQAIAIARRLGAARELSETLLAAAKIKEMRGELKQAVACWQQYHALNDTLLGLSTRRTIQELEIRYGAAQKDKSIAEQQLQLEHNRSAIRQKNNLLAFAGIGIAALIAVSLMGVRIARERQQAQQQRIAALQNEQEVIRLKAMLEGQDLERRRISKEMHDDIGSGLTTILYLGESLKGSTGDNKSISKMAGVAHMLVEKMNEIIWSMNKEFDTLEDLVAYIRQHAAELLENNDLEYDFDIPVDIQAVTISGEQRRNIYLTLKETLHNTIKHAGATLVSLRVDYRNGALDITIRDNGKGIDLDALRRFGNGLRNMQQRMEYVGGSYSIAAEGGTVTRLSVPLA